MGLLEKVRRSRVYLFVAARIVETLQGGFMVAQVSRSCIIPVLGVLNNDSLRYALSSTTLRMSPFKSRQNNAEPTDDVRDPSATAITALRAINTITSPFPLLSGIASAAEDLIGLSQVGLTFITALLLLMDGLVAC